MSEGMKDTIQFAVKNEKALKKENERLREALEDIRLTAETKMYEYNHFETNRLAATIDYKARQALNGTNT